MYSVRITHKESGKLVAQIATNVQGQNFTPIPAQHHAQAWRSAIKDGLIEADADKDDYAFEMVPVSMHDVFSQRR